MAAAPVAGPASDEDRPAVDSGFLFEQAVAAYVLLSVTLWADDGALGLWSAVPFLGCIYLLVDTGRRLGQAAAAPGRAGLGRARWTRYLVLLALLAGGRRPGFYLEPGTPQWAFSGLAAVLLGAALLSIHGRLSQAQRDGLAAVMLAAAAAAGALLLQASPSPRIDVFTVQQRGAAALLAGDDPYALHYPNPYGASESAAYFGAYSPTLRCYPYPPLSLLVSAAGWWLFGDVRAAFLALQLLTGALLYAMVRRQSSATASGLCALHLLSPRGLFVIEQGFTEPLLMASLAAWTALALRRPRASRRAQLGQGLVLGLVLGAKQYAVLLLPLFLAQRFRPAWPRAALWRTTGLAVAVGGLGLLPFLLWHPRELFEDLVLFQVRQPFRPDALSLPALLHFATGLRAPGGLALLGAAASLAWSFPRLPRQLAGLLLGAALGCFGFFATAKQAFCNYYSLVAVLLLLCAAACTHPEPAA